MSRLVLAALLFQFSSLFAQEDLQVSMKLKTLSVGEVSSFVVFIPQAEYNNVVKDWERYLESGTKEKIINTQGEIIITDKLFEKISPTTINVFSYIKEYDGEIMLVAAFEIEGTFISRDMDEEIYLPAKKYIRDFAVLSYRAAVENELKEEEKKLKKLENQATSLISSKENLLYENNQYQRSILAKKDEITINQLDQSNKIIQVQAQKELVLKLANAGEAEKEEASQILKELEKDFKKLQKENEGLYQNINEIEIYIRENEIAMAKVDAEIKYLNLDKEDQAYHIRKVQEKLERIK